MLRHRAELGVVGEYRAPAARSDDLVAVEAQRRDSAERAAVASPVKSSERLGGILDQREGITFACLDQPVQIRWMAERMHHDNGGDRRAGEPVMPSSGAPLADIREMIGELPGVESERARIGVCEMGCGSAVGNGVGGGDEAERWHYDLVTGLDAGQLKADLQRGGTVDDGYCMLRARLVAQSLLEAIHKSAERRHPP